MPITINSDTNSFPSLIKAVNIGHSHSKRIFYALFLSFTLLSTTALSFSVKTTENMNNNILCVGICSLDTVATLNEFPTPDAKLRSTSLTHSGGGNAANTAVAISRLSHNIPHLKQLQLNVDILSAIGNDSNGDYIQSELKGENVGTSLIERFDGDSPWSYIMIVDDTRTIVHQPSTRDLSIEYIQSNLLQFQDQINTDMCDKDNGHKLSDYAAVHFDCRHPEAAVNVAKECKKLDIPYSVDVERPRDGLLDILSGATVVICNANYIDLVLDRDEVKGERGKYNTDEEIVKRFKEVMMAQAPCAEIGVMTLGSRGSCLINLGDNMGDDGDVLKAGINDDNQGGITNSPAVIHKHGALWCEAFPDCNIIDTTGAGDAFQGGFISAIWGYSMLSFGNENKSQGAVERKKLQVPKSKVVLGHALRIGSRVSAKKIEMEGARAGLPRNDAFIESEFNAMVYL